MATKRIASIAEKFPVGTSVTIYPSVGRPSTGYVGTPTGSSAGSATVAADGSLAYSGLADSTGYVAYAQVGGVDTYVQFYTDPTGSITTPVPQDGIADTAGSSGQTAATPTAGTAVATIAAPGAGTYDVYVSSYTTVVADTTNSNMTLRHGTTAVCDVPSQLNVPGRVGPIRVSVAAGESINVITKANAPSTAVQNATITATRVQ